MPQEIKEQQALANKTGSLAEGASAASAQAQEAAREFAAMLGQTAAMQTLASGGDIPQGRVVQGSMPGIPAPVVDPSMQPRQYREMPPQGGGHTNYGLRKAFDKAEFFNSIGRTVNQYSNEAKQREVQKTAREYEIVMMTIQALQQDPTNQHNIQLLNTLLDPNTPEGKKRLQRFEKVLGFDAFDPAKEAKKQNDPDNQAFQAAAQKVLGGINGTMVPGGGADPASIMADTASVMRTPGFNSSQGAEEALTKQVGPAYMGQLNSGAQSFLKQFPQMPQAPAYAPSPQELAAKWRISAGISPNAKERLDFTKALIETEKDIGIEIMKEVSAKDLALLDNYYKTQNNVYDNVTKYRIALLDFQSDALDRALEREKIGAGKKADDIKHAETLFTVHQKRVDLAREKYMTLVNAMSADAKKTGKGVTPEQVKELTAAKDSWADAEARMHQAGKSFEDLVGEKRGYSIPPSGVNAGEQVVKGLEGDSGAAGGKSSASPDRSRSGNESTSRQSSDKSVTDYFKRGVKYIREEGPINFVKEALVPTDEL
jgi:hypothetical protein